MARWITGNRFLSMDEMKNNALIVWAVLGGAGWTLHSVAATLGNMESESNINPGIWEGLQEGNLNGGFGLTQWTPATKYIDWAGGDESNWNNGNKELDRILYEVENNLQWFANQEAPTPNPPITFKQYTQSTDDPSKLANYFLWYYEHPTTTIQPDRGRQALAWFEFLDGYPYHRHPKFLWLYMSQNKRWLKNSNLTN